MRGGSETGNVFGGERAMLLLPKGQLLLPKGALGFNEVTDILTTAWPPGGCRAALMACWGTGDHGHTTIETQAWHQAWHDAWHQPRHRPHRNPRLTRLA
ncbi:hypothetical protein BRADO3713 [Bradyrhizobium sp. ORS 278]|nr:hypothetical protein BRADO3713 [Bradyrhizobium sp. ORS 278]